MGFIDEIKARAKADKKVIVLPETEDERTYKAAQTVLREGIADLILVGNEEEIEKNIKSLREIISKKIKRDLVLRKNSIKSTMT